MNQHMRSHDHKFAPIKSTVEARQGISGHNARYVLIVSTLSVIILLALIYALS